MSVARVRWVRMVALICGCGPAVGTVDESGGDADGTGDSGDSPTTGAATTQATATTAGTSVGSTDATTTTTTTGPAGCSADWVPGCQAYCAANITCHPDLGTFEACVMECISGFGELTPECQVAWCEAYTCMGALDCESFDAGTPECDVLGGEAEELCGDAGSRCLVGAGSDGTCSYACDDPPRRLSCDKVTCTCEQDGVPTGSCPADGICDTFDDIDVFAAACCGW